MLLWNGGEAPEDWMKDVMCPIRKKGDRTQCSNYRAVCLMSHALKVCERILEERLRRHIEQLLGEQQSDFRPGRGTTDMTFALKMILEKTWEWNKKYVAFINLEKDFDRVLRQKLWVALEDEYYGIPPMLGRAILNTYQNTKCKVKSQCGSSDWFEVKSGV